jgi:hypothetical protein
VLRARVRTSSGVRVIATAAVVLLSWAGVLAAAAAALVHAGVPTTQVVAYLGAWLVGCTFPGVMVWRALGGHTTFARELGFGSVLGIVLQLVFWAAGTAVHRPRPAMALLPIAVLVAFLVVPGLRRHWWPRRTARTRTPVRWHVAMAVVAALAAYRFDRLVGIRRALPPEPTLVARDSWYNSAISYELSRTLRPQDPYAVGEPLRYHWFADAHVTATAQLSGTSIANAMVATWLVPTLVVLLLAVAAAAQHFLDAPRSTAPDGTVLSDVRRWWVGPTAALFAYAATPIWRLGRPAVLRVGDGFVPSSPSGILALLLILCLAAPILDLLRRRARRGTWVLLTLLLAASVGTKPSILPVVAFGAGVVLVVDLIRRRGLNRPMAYVIAMSAVLAAAAAPVLTGSTGGSHPQLLALVTIDPSYARLLDGDRVVPGAGGWLVPALADGLPDAVPVIAMLLLVWVLSETPRLLSLAGLTTRPLRADPGVRWACGVVAGGYGAMWVLAHSGYSEHYFWTVTVALGTVLSITNAVRLLPAARRAWTLVLPVVLVAAPGMVAAHLTTTLDRVDLDGPTWAVIVGRLRPYALMGAALVVSMVVAVLLRVLVRRWSLPMLTAVTAFALGACLPIAFLTVRDARPPRTDPLPKVGRSYAYVSPEQSRAALWLQRNSATTSVVATNQFCWPMGRDTPNCLINSAWLSGISGRRLVLGDWTYTTANFSAYDGTVPINRMPSPWPERVALSRQAVENPTPEVLQRLRRDYGARWIFADRRATRISPELERLADLRYRSANIRIYRLADSYAP